MENTAQNNQNQDTKTQKTTLTLKKVYYGLWGIYFAISTYLILYFRPTGNRHYYTDNFIKLNFNGSFVWDSTMILILTSVVFLHMRQKGAMKILSPIIFFVAGVHVLVSFARIYFERCKDVGSFCEVEAGIIASIDGLLVVLFILSIGFAIKVFMKSKNDS